MSSDVFLLIDAWSAALVRATWQGGLMAAVVAIVSRLAPSIPVRFQVWLWRLVALKFCAALLGFAPLEVPLLPAPPLAGPLAAPCAAPIEVGFMPAGAVQAPNAGAVISPWPILFVAWLAAVAWQAVRLKRAFRGAGRLRAAGYPCPDAGLHDQLAAACRSIGLRTSPRLLEVEGDGSPFLLGIFRPTIVFPGRTLERLDAGERRLVVHHELAHLVRRDLAWSLLATIVRILFFFHPLAWLCERRLQGTQETAADDLAMRHERQGPLHYATRLVSIVGKLGPQRLAFYDRPELPTLCVGAVGSHSSLQQRFLAMLNMKPVSRCSRVLFSAALGLLGPASLVPWTMVAAEPPASETRDRKIDERAPVVPREKTERGRFVSYQQGRLVIEANSGARLENVVPASAKTFVWNDGETLYKPADTEASLRQASPGAWCMVHVGKQDFTIRVGSRKGKTIGTFVSYKDDRLLVLAKNLGGTFVKKYGNNVHFNKFRADVPVYESIDGGEYQLAGTPGTVLGSVKEGTVLTVHGEGDDNITRIDIGTPK